MLYSWNTPHQNRGDTTKYTFVFVDVEKMSEPVSQLCTQRYDPDWPPMLARSLPSSLKERWETPSWEHLVRKQFFFSIKIILNFLEENC